MSGAGLDSGRAGSSGLYVVGYGLGRLWVEALRIDPASHILGIRVNIWVSVLAIAGAAAWLLTRAVRRRQPGNPPVDLNLSDPPETAVGREMSRVVFVLLGALGYYCGTRTRRIRMEQTDSGGRHRR